jgi:hypothetical protein
MNNGNSDGGWPASSCGACSARYGSPAGHEGEYGAARPRALAVEAADQARASGDASSLATQLGLLGAVERASGANERAGELYTEAVSLHEALGTC